MRRLLLLAGASLSAALLGCGNAGADKTAPAVSTDRVVGVSKQINEFTYAIGAERHLVAHDLTSVYPEAIKQLPSVGYHRALSAEGILSMKPTALLTDGNVGPDAVLDQVRQVGVPVVTLKPGVTLEDAQRLLTQVGDFFDDRPAADRVLAGWQAGMDSIFADTARWGSGPRPRVLVMHFGQIANDYLAVSRGGPADQMIQWAGGVNAIDSVGGMTRLTPELIARVAPDVIIATDVGYDRLGSADAFAALPGVALTPAGEARRIYRIDEGLLMYFGPRTPAAVRDLAALIHR
jgi:iron complex transport system substrate-binding protein